MIESLRGPKGTIIESLIPIVTMMGVVIWLVYVHFRERKGEVIPAKTTWGVVVLMMVGGCILTVVYTVLQGAR
jgi:hypothetical protein